MVGILEKQMGRTYQSTKKEVKFTTKKAKSTAKKDLKPMKVTADSLQEIGFLRQIWNLKYNYEVIETLIEKAKLTKDEQETYETLKKLLKKGSKSQ